MARGEIMLTQAVESYLAVRRAMGFALHSEGSLLQSLAEFSDAAGKGHVCTETAIEWAGSARSPTTRARRLGQVIRFARYIRAEDQRHEMPPTVFGSETPAAPCPLHLFQGRHPAFSSKPRPNWVVATPFAVIPTARSSPCWRVPAYVVSEAIRLTFNDITSDGLIIRCSKFRKSRLVPLHETTQAGLERYLQARRSYAPFDDHVFVSLRRRRLLVGDAETAFHESIKKIGLPRGPGLPRPTIHSLRHSFAVRALETCPDGRDRITKHMLALSTYLGHSKVADTYWYLEATPDLMRDIADSCQNFFSRGQL
jgi:integrase/recombinase XerD